VATNPESWRILWEGVPNRADAQTPTVFLPVEQLGGLHFERLRQGHDGIQGNYPVSALDQADVIGMHMGTGG
jgi:hypothetical protein